MHTDKAHQQNERQEYKKLSVYNNDLFRLWNTHDVSGGSRTLHKGVQGELTYLKEGTSVMLQWFPIYTYMYLIKQIFPQKGGGGPPAPFPGLDPPMDLYRKRETFINNFLPLSHIC